MICFKGSEKKLKKKAALGIRKDAAEDVSEDQLKQSSTTAASTTVASTTATSTTAASTTAASTTDLKRASGEYHTDEAVAKVDYYSVTVNFEQGESVKVMP